MERSPPGSPHRGSFARRWYGFTISSSLKRPTLDRRFAAGGGAAHPIRRTTDNWFQNQLRALKSNPCLMRRSERSALNPCARPRPGAISAGSVYPAQDHPEKHCGTTADQRTRSGELPPCAGFAPCSGRAALRDGSARIRGALRGLRRRRHSGSGAHRSSRILLPVRGCLARDGHAGSRSFAHTRPGSCPGLDARRAGGRSADRRSFHDAAPIAASKYRLSDHTRQHPPPLAGPRPQQARGFPRAIPIYQP